MVERDLTSSPCKVSIVLDLTLTVVGLVLGLSPYSPGYNTDNSRLSSWP